jgi:cysteine desulfurase / selenocysteine lyase
VIYLTEGKSLRSARPSFAFYNTFDEIDVFLNAVRRIAEGGIAG